MADGFSFADDDKKAPSGAAPKSGFSWDADDPTHAQAAARVAQPTQFEQASAARGDSATPWKDTLKGIPEGLMQPVASVAGMINKIPKVGETLAPSQGVKALQQLTTATTPGEKLGAREADVATTLIPIAGEVGKAREAGTLVPYATRLATGLVGTAAGSTIGREVGRHIPIIGGETLGQIGEAAGGLAGGLAGGGAFGEGRRTIGNPRELPYVGKYLPDLLKAKEVPTAMPSVMSDKPLELTSPVSERETPIQDALHFPAPVEEPEPYSASPMKRMGQLVREQGGAPAGGMPTLQPGVSLRNQPQSVGAASAGFPRIDPNAPLREQQLQKPFGNRVAPEVSETFGPRTVAPEKLPQEIPNAVSRAMGEEVTPAETEKERLQRLYPDSGERQLVHINGEKMYEATKDDRRLMKAITDLKAHDNQGGPDLARAAANLGEDLGEKRIGNKKAEWMGAGQIGRSEMFDRLLDKGYTAQEILDAAHRSPESRPGLIRSQPWTKPNEKTGD
jgi:hypothetical protein